MNTKLNTIKLLSVLALAVFGLNANAQLQTQIHVHSDGGDNFNGLKSTIGHQNIAEGNYSLAAGWGNQSKGQTSFAIGYYNLAEGLNSIAIGMYTKSQSAHSITIGNGYSFDKPLLNNTEGMMLGMGSNLPTLFISQCSENHTGKVAIGNCTSPQAKLHIKADNDEDADITLEPVQNKDASIMFRNKEIFIKVEKSGKMSITVPSKPIVFNASKYCFGSERIYMKNEGTDGFSVSVPETMSMEALRFRFSGNEAIDMEAQNITSHAVGSLTLIGDDNVSVKTNDKMDFKANRFRFGNTNGMKITLQGGLDGSGTALFSNAYLDGTTYMREGQGSSYAFEFKDDALRIRTAVNQDPRGTEITNWKDALFVTTDGKLGIGSKNTFLRNQDDQDFLLSSPKKTTLLSEQIQLQANDSIDMRALEISSHAIDNLSLISDKSINAQGKNIDMEADQINLTGKVGINMENTSEDLDVAIAKGVYAPNGFTLNSCNGTERKPIMLQGCVNINTTTDYTDDWFSLAVKGGILAEQVLIKSSGSWPDFVFASNYELMPLGELKTYIQTNRHLPDVPSESQVNEQGVEVGEMQSVLLKKIEELTLYTIQLQEQVEQLQQKVNEIETK